MTNWKKVVEQGYQSTRFHAHYDAPSYLNNKVLSERQLFTQSNGRVLLGQDTLGRLHFIAAPHDKDYAVPTMIMDCKNHIAACPGMYYQTNVTMFLGKMQYELHTDSGDVFPCATEGSSTVYTDHFLPVTQTVYPNIQMNTVSIAPVLDCVGRRSMKSLPLPGPSGAIYGISIRNTGEEKLCAKIRLKFDNAFMSKYEHCNDSVESRAYPCVYSEVDNHLLIMQRPEGFTGIHMRGGIWRQAGDFWYGEEEITLDAQEEVLIETYVCVSEILDGISEALGIFYQHTMDDWIGITAEFWKKNLGNLTVYAKTNPDLAVASMEIHIRNILDNFNCIQTDATGRVLVHWQGAPSHNYARMWGIDVEPTTLSFIHIFPELGLKLLEYMLERNEPRYSPYPEHSVPIMMAPLIMAGKYFEYTADSQYFLDHPNVTSGLEGIWNKIVGFCPPGRNLVPSRYSSDGIVMRRYDHGTNVKFWYGCHLYAKICNATGQQEKAKEVRVFLQKLKQDILDTMIQNGPFGEQITGGTNLGEVDAFYMDEDFFYYDGEDSASVLAPIYGIYDFDFKPWIHYHCFARSLFASNYDPEMNALTWFPYGGAVDGTAFVSQVGGIINKSEMARSFANLVSGAVDETGSLYWWPKAENMRRMIARCSQGQGSWILQYQKQWLGVSFDAEDKVLEVTPLGMLDGYEWCGAKFGYYTFDISYKEEAEQSRITVTNHNEATIKVVFGCRSYGAGAVGKVAKTCGVILPGETETLSNFVGNYAAEVTCITSIEANNYGDANGIIFNHYGFEQPYIENLEQTQNIFLLRFVIVNGTNHSMTDISVDITYPPFFKMQAKQVRLWSQANNMSKGSVCAKVAPIEPGTRQVAPFWVEAESAYHAQKAWFDKHPFLLEKGGNGGKLIIESDQILEKCEIIARLNYTIGTQRYEKSLLIPVETKPEKAFMVYAKTFLGALS